MDLNCDLGEDFGIYSLGGEGLLPFVTSVNVACGFHAGDPGVMRRTVEAAAQAGVAVGAHPGYPDKQGFGRRAMQLSPQEVEDDILYQMGALAAFCQVAGVPLRHVKPHGALYNQASREADMAFAVARAIARLNLALFLYAPPGSALAEAGTKAGLRVVREGFADRGYRADGQLVERGQPGALVGGLAEAVAQGVSLARRGGLTTQDGKWLQLPVETVCLHGDSPGSLELAHCLVGSLQEAGIRLAAPEA